LPLLTNSITPKSGSTEVMSCAFWGLNLLPASAACRTLP
jgi:hypothetical protein